MHEVLAQAIHQILLACRKEGIADLSPLTDGLPFSERTLARRPFGRVDWEPFTELLDRIADELGGPGALARIGRRFYAEHRPLSDLLRLVVSPRNAYRVCGTSIAPWLWPANRCRHEFLPGNRVRLVGEIPSGLRGSLPFWHGTEGAAVSVPRALGLAESKATVEERTPRRLVLTLRMPPARTVAARMAPGEEILRAIEAHWAERIEELRTRLGELAEIEKSRRALPPALDRAKAAFRLTPREAEVAALLLEGLSNREIAGRLGCAPGTIEAHLSRIFEKAAVDGRAELAKRLWSGER